MAGDIFYHAGPRSIAKTGMVRPASDLGLDYRSAYASSRCEYAADRVYVTSSPRYAIVMATRVPNAQGVVFEVEPIGEVIPDTDYVSKTSGPCEAFMCDAARVIRRVKVSGKMTLPPAFIQPRLESGGCSLLP